MADLSLVRHQSIFNPTKHKDRIHIIGAGATGSRVFASLVELGVTNISVYDYDVVEAHNLANQIYSAMDAMEGIPKVEALARWYEAKTLAAPPASIEFHNQRVDIAFPARPLDGYVFLLTDTMASRKEIFNIYLHSEVCGDIKRVIETRMASLHGNIYHFDPNDPDQTAAWEASLTDDETTELSPCGTSISVGTTANIIANLAVQQYMWLCENPDGANARTDIYLRPLMVIAGDKL